MAQLKVRGRKTRQMPPSLTRTLGTGMPVRKGMTFSTVKGMTVSKVPRVSHFNCWRRSGFCLPHVVAVEDQGGQHVVERQVAHGELVKTCVQQLRGLPAPHCATTCNAITAMPGR